MGIRQVEEARGIRSRKLFTQAEREFAWAGCLVARLTVITHGAVFWLVIDNPPNVVKAWPLDEEVDGEVTMLVPRQGSHLLEVLLSDIKATRVCRYDLERHATHGVGECFVRMPCVCPSYL